MIAQSPEVVVINHADVHDAFVMGQLDALDGEMCCPEMYYATKHQKTLYCLGYEDVSGPNDTTRWFTGELPDAADDYDDIRYPGLI